LPKTSNFRRAHAASRSPRPRISGPPRLPEVSRLDHQCAPHTCAYPFLWPPEFDYPRYRSAMTAKREDIIPSTWILPLKWRHPTAPYSHQRHKHLCGLQRCFRFEQHIDANQSSDDCCLQRERSSPIHPSPSKIKPEVQLRSRCVRRFRPWSPGRAGISKESCVSNRAIWRTLDGGANNEVQAEGGYPVSNWNKASGRPLRSD